MLWPGRWPIDWQSAAGRLAALAAAVACSIKQNYRLLGAKGYKERVFGPEKLGSRGPIALLSFLQLRFFVTFFVGTVSSLVHRRASEWLCTRGHGLQTRDGVSAAAQASENTP